MVCRRRSAHAVSVQGQNSSSCVQSAGTRSKNLRRALLHLGRLHRPDLAVGLIQAETYSVRSFWHRSSTLQALAASRQRFTVVMPTSESVDGSEVKDKRQISVEGSTATGPKGFCRACATCGMYAVYLFNMPRCNLARVEGSKVEICTSELKIGFKVEVSVNEHCSLISRITKGSAWRGVGSHHGCENLRISQDVSRTQWAFLCIVFLMLMFSILAVQTSEFRLLSCSTYCIFAVQLRPLSVIRRGASLLHRYGSSSICDFSVTNSADAQSQSAFIKPLKYDYRMGLFCALMTEFSADITDITCPQQLSKTQRN